MRKKLVSLILALIMAFSLSVTIYAGGGCGPGGPPRSFPPPCIECECNIIVAFGGGDGPDGPP